MLYRKSHTKNLVSVGSPKVCRKGCSVGRDVHTPLVSLPRGSPIHTEEVDI